MRTLRSRTRRTALTACLALSVSAAAVVSAAPAAQAALPPSPGCGFHAGPILSQGAAGTEYFGLDLIPNSPAQHCIAFVTYTVTAASGGGLYHNILRNPLKATEPVGFTPGRLAPEIGLAWGGFHCADPAVPGTITFTIGTQTVVDPITPSSCAGNGFPSTFDAFVPPVVSAVGIAPTTSNHGYTTVAQNETLTPKGDATTSTAKTVLTAPVVGIATAPTGNGGWIVDASGRVASFGSASAFGDASTLQLEAPIVGIAPTTDGKGYWLAAADGGVFAFGDARFFGSLGNLPLNAPVVGIARSADGNGYWLDAFDGGVFAFGDAAYLGSLGNVVLNAPVVGMAAGPHGGYWLVASDGGVFAFGVPFEGSAGGIHLNAPISGMAATASGKGYWLVGADNGVFDYGDAGFYGASPFGRGL